MKEKGLGTGWVGRGAFIVSGKVVREGNTEGTFKQTPGSERGAMWISG